MRLTGFNELDLWCCKDILQFSFNFSFALFLCFLREEPCLSLWNRRFALNLPVFIAYFHRFNLVSTLSLFNFRSSYLTFECFFSLKFYSRQFALSYSSHYDAFIIQYCHFVLIVALSLFRFRYFVLFTVFSSFRSCRLAPIIIVTSASIIVGSRRSVLVISISSLHFRHFAVNPQYLVLSTLPSSFRSCHLIVIDLIDHSLSLFSSRHIVPDILILLTLKSYAVSTYCVLLLCFLRTLQSQ